MIIKNEKSGMYYKNAFLTNRAAENRAWELNRAYKYAQYSSCEIDLPYVGKYVLFLNAYYGFDYGFVSMHNVVRRSKVYASRADAMMDPIWIEAEQKMKEKPENYIRDQEGIASNLLSIKL